MRLGFEKCPGQLCCVITLGTFGRIYANIYLKIGSANESLVTPPISDWTLRNLLQVYEEQYE